MNMPTKAELIHYKIQAALRENHFGDDQIKYLGMSDNQHWYLIGGEHKVSANQLTEFEMEYDD